ncbi:MAG: NADH-quinone oxidoreductase subunit C [Chitinophagales bacterium]|nr:NADH-quinone oxidoreductase subunit C [Chitinophagales bacterium]MDW8392800.1 NADH-quinone oxidoreductase subunit C [Chitinophagales bacterium]
MNEPQTAVDWEAVVAHAPVPVQLISGTPWPELHVEAPNWPDLAQFLRTAPELQLDYLFCLTCVDWKTHLTMVYHLNHSRQERVVVVKSQLDRDQPQIASVAGIWRTAEFHEREVFEMFGVQFLGHPDLRLLILPEGWEGRNPLRKDYEDPVNMIRL